MVISNFAKKSCWGNVHLLHVLYTLDVRKWFFSQLKGKFWDLRSEEYFQQIIFASIFFKFHISNNLFNTQHMSLEKRKYPKIPIFFIIFSLSNEWVCNLYGDLSGELAARVLGSGPTILLRLGHPPLGPWVPRLPVAGGQSLRVPGLYGRRVKVRVRGWVRRAFFCFQGKTLLTPFDTSLYSSEHCCNHYWYKTNIEKKIILKVVEVVFY